MMRIEHGDMREVLARFIAEGVAVQSIVTDPPYGLAFMGRKWDAPDNVAFRADAWRLCFDLLPPGGHLVAFSGARTYHRMAVAIEDAGFEIRDMISWLYGSGFPKSHNVSKAIDRAAGVEREETRAGKVNRGGYGEDWDTAQSATRPRFDEPVTDEARAWNGWGTALKPAMEPICVARKPIDGTVAANVLKHGTGALNIDGCRIEGDKRWPASESNFNGWTKSGESVPTEPRGSGRWPANIIHDGSDEVVSAFPDSGTGSTGSTAGSGASGIYGDFERKTRGESIGFADSGSAARFFYSSKADADDRLGSKHPTVKPVDLMRWLVRLITPPGGTVLDPFAGSGTTGMACMAEGFDAILVDSDPESIADIRRRVAHVHGDDTPLFARAAE